MSRRVFMHIDEYGIDGFGQLIHIICVSNPVVLWAPSAILLESAKKAGATDLTWVALLKLINRSDTPVRVVARREWFDRAWRNNHPFAGARWIPRFDDELADYAEQDEKLAPENRRVIIADPERGYKKADELLSGTEGNSIRAKIGLLFRQKLLPQGTMEKALRDIEAGKPYVRTIVRDLYNHVYAKNEARATIAATPCEHLLVLAEAVTGTRASALTTLDDSGGPADEQDLREAVRILKSLPTIVDTNGLFRFLSNKKLRRDLLDLLFSERGSKTLRQHLVREMEKITEIPPFLSQFLRQRDPVGLSVTLGGVALTVANLKLTDQVSFGLVGVAINALKGLAMKHNIIPASIPWRAKARALFYLTLGTKRPTIKRVKALCEWVERDKE